MPSGKANIQSANPPSELKPNAIAIIVTLHEPEEEAEAKPREEHDERCLQENRLGLREFLNGVKFEDGLGEAHCIVGNAGVCGNGRASRELYAAVGCPVQHMSHWAGALATIENDAVRRACHLLIFVLQSLPR